MAETKTMLDPFLNQRVEISTRLVDRLRGRYACGPTLPNGEPEFGWREFETAPVQQEAADEIERLRNIAKELSDTLLTLRPLGGSESFVKRGEDYYADPVYFHQMIQHLKETRQSALMDAVRLKKAALLSQDKKAG